MREGIRSLILLLVVGPCTFIPALILYLKAPGIDPMALFKGKLGSSGHVATEAFRCNIFLSLLFYGVVGLDLLCLAVPQLGGGRRHGDFLRVRRYFVATGGLMVGMVLGGALLYESTLVRDAAVISQYVKQRPKSASASAGTAAGTGGAEVTLGSGLVYVAERVLIALIIVTMFMGLERLLLERIKVGYCKRNGHNKTDAKAKDVHILKRLHTVLRTVFFVIGGVMAAPFFDFGTARLWVTYGVLMATLGFMLKGAARTAFEALILVFVRHPYDVGDEVVVDGVRLRVGEIRVFTTQFEKVEDADQAAALYIPNARMMDKSVANITRGQQESNQQ